ncbi:hypothetical protein [Kitasatospora sp. NPDC004272]
MPARPGPGEGRWGRIDPYRDTALNEQDAGAALAELPRPQALAEPPGQRGAVRDLGRMLADCGATPGSRLLFVGDRIARLRPGAVIAAEHAPARAVARLLGTVRDPAADLPDPGVPAGPGRRAVPCRISGPAAGVGGGPGAAGW